MAVSSDGTSGKTTASGGTAAGGKSISTTTKTTAAKRSLAKKTTAPAANNDPDRAPDSAPIPQTAPPSEEAVKKSLGKLGTGRERDIRLKAAGINPRRAQKERAQARAAKS